ncbi:MAG: ferritin family protein [Magnetococcales bacterium]|nr:ferritin family protein [Magnetococcales bacterium]
MHSFTEVIRFAIRHEEAEAQFYREMAERSRTPDQKEIMLDHARQEEDHKRRLLIILENDVLPMGERRFPDPDLKLSEYLMIGEHPTGQIGYEEALLLAAKREKKAHKLYQTLATQAQDPVLKAALTFLAEQEAKHANALEQEYDDTQP